LRTERRGPPNLAYQLEVYHWTSTRSAPAAFDRQKGIELRRIGSIETPSATHFRFEVVK
jgi:hypothetical protein